MNQVRKKKISSVKHCIIMTKLVMMSFSCTKDRKFLYWKSRKMIGGGGGI